ncbi:MAG: hypothetical protein JWL93_1259 [Hyphomicrobiales bacterium]|nr:hypothetical protein [Hyphomicrobiales bacterium]
MSLTDVSLASGHGRDAGVRETPTDDLLTERERVQGRALLLRQVGRGLKSLYPTEQGSSHERLRDALGRCLRSIEGANSPHG